MSLEMAKDQLVEILGDEDNKVIALSGQWGTGKTYLWNQVTKESEHEKVRDALYVSLFGLSNIDQVKGKLLEASIPLPDIKGVKTSTVMEIFSTASSHFSVLESMAKVGTSFAAPKVLCNKLIVIDDIERKDKKLGINEILGFIDEYSVQHSAQFVLILNEEKLPKENNQRERWATFREKVIDHEIKLSTTPDEAFEIALKMMPSPYANAIKKASSTCNLTNIRIIKKTIKTTNNLLADRALENAIMLRVVPSVVLFTAIYLNGMDEGLDFEFAINIGNTIDYLAKRHQRDSAPNNVKPEELKADEWRDLIHKLGIFSCDDFENQLVRFLESGLYEKTSIDAILDRYVKEQGEIEVKNEAEDFISRFYWDLKSDESQLVEKASQLTSKAILLNPFLVTEMCSVLDKIPSGKKVALELLAKWIEAYENGDSLTKDIDNTFSKPLHEDIQAAHDKKTEALHGNRSIKDAVLYLKSTNSWGLLEENVMKQASVRDFDEAIRNLEYEETQPFMAYMINISNDKSMYDKHFGKAAEHFTDACRNIVEDSPTSRLGSIILRLYPNCAIDVTPLPATLDHETQ